MQLVGSKFSILFFCLYYRDLQCLNCNKISRPPRKRIRMRHTPKRKTEQILSSAKHGFKIKASTVYWIPYKCGKFYIRQTGRLSKRGARNTGDTYVCINMRIRQWQNTASVRVLRRLQRHLHISPNIRTRGSPCNGSNLSTSEQEYFYRTEQGLVTYNLQVNEPESQTEHGRYLTLSLDSCQVTSRSGQISEVVSSPKTGRGMVFERFICSPFNHLTQLLS